MSMAFISAAIPAVASALQATQDQQNKKMALTKNQQTIQDI